MRRIYVGQKYSHIYMLSISTGKNQSLKIRGALYIPTYEYNYKVITRCDTLVQEYYITDRRKCENTKRCTNMNSIKALTSLQKENSRGVQGPGRIEVQMVCWRSKLPLHLLGQQQGESRSSKLQMKSPRGRVNR